MEEKKRKIKSLLRSVLISSKEGIPRESFNKEYRILTNEKIPFRELGFQTLDDFIASIPDVVRIERRGPETIYVAVADASTAKLKELVDRQKTSKRASIVRKPLSRQRQPYNSFDYYSSRIVRPREPYHNTRPPLSLLGRPPLIAGPPCAVQTNIRAKQSQYKINDGRIDKSQISQLVDVSKDENNKTEEKFKDTRKRRKKAKAGTSSDKIFYNSNFKHSSQYNYNGRRNYPLVDDGHKLGMQFGCQENMAQLARNAFISAQYFLALRQANKNFCKMHYNYCEDVFDTNDENLSYLPAQRKWANSYNQFGSYTNTMVEESDLIINQRIAERPHSEKYQSNNSRNKKKQQFVKHNHHKADNKASVSNQDGKNVGRPSAPNHCDRDTKDYQFENHNSFEVLENSSTVNQGNNYGGKLRAYQNESKGNNYKAENDNHQFESHYSIAGKYSAKYKINNWHTNQNNQRWESYDNYKKRGQQQFRPHKESHEYYRYGNINRHFPRY